MTTGEQLRYAREKQGMTIPELAEKSGVSVGTISQVERDIGDAQLSTLQKLTKALGMTINDLDL